MGIQGRGKQTPKTRKKLEKARFVQEVPVGQMAQGTPFRCLPLTPPPISVGGGTGGRTLMSFSMWYSLTILKN